MGRLEEWPPRIEVKSFPRENAFVRDFWIKLPISEQVLFGVWKTEKQGSVESLVVRLEKAFRDWLVEIDVEQPDSGIEEVPDGR